MFDNLKPGDIIEKHEFDVVMASGEVHRYTLALEKSRSFQYGNGTRVSLKIDGRFSTAFDTRYVPGIVNDFSRWAKVTVSAVMRDVCSIYPVDPATGKRIIPSK